MVSKKWFRAKMYGWGWYPATWQGWVTLALYSYLIIFMFRNVDQSSHSASDTLINFTLPAIALTALFIFLCYGTGEKPEWRWGAKKDTTLD
jgi:hypothetical protein